MGSIVVPYYTRGQTTLVSQIVPYYVGVKNNQMKVVKPSFNVIPRLGWIVDHTEIFQLMKEQDIPTKFPNKEARTIWNQDVATNKDCQIIWKTEVATVFSGAHILSYLFDLYPESHCGSETVNSMMNLYQKVNQINIYF
jgi:hypothetical protein